MSPSVDTTDPAQLKPTPNPKREINLFLFCNSSLSLVQMVSGIEAEEVFPNSSIEKGAFSEGIFDLAPSFKKTEPLN